MVLKQYIQKQYYVFSRWSRKSWALFSAIGKQIKIGAVAIRLGDMAYKRSLIAGSFLSASYTLITSVLDQLFEFDSGQECLLQKVQVQHIHTNKSNDTLDTNSRLLL